MSFWDWVLGTPVSTPEPTAASIEAEETTLKNQLRECVDAVSSKGIDLTHEVSDASVAFSLELSLRYEFFKRGFGRIPINGLEIKIHPSEEPKRLNWHAHIKGPLIPLTPEERTKSWEQS